MKKPRARPPPEASDDVDDLLAAMGGEAAPRRRRAAAPPVPAARRGRGWGGAAAGRGWGGETAAGGGGGGTSAGGWGAAASAGADAAAAVSAVTGSADDVVVAVARSCMASGASRAELVAELARILGTADAEQLASMLVGETPLPASPARVEEQHTEPPAWAAAEGVDARLSVAELRARLRLLGVSTQGMAERSELEAAHRQAMWPPEPEPEPEPQPADPRSLAQAELHRQLLRLALYLMPDPQECEARGDLAQRVSAIIHRACPDDPPASRYGSEALGLAAFTSDIDICLTMVSSSRSGRAAALRWIGAALRQTTWASKVDVRENARFPIVNFKDELTDLEVDVSLDKCETTGLVETLRAEYTALEPLCLILKVLLEQAGLNTPYTGGLGSFKLYVLIAHYLSRREIARQPWADAGPLTWGALAGLMIGVLQHAARDFDWQCSFTFAGGVHVDYISVYGSDRVADYCGELAEQLQQELDREEARLERAAGAKTKDQDLEQPAGSSEAPTWRGLMRVVEAGRLSSKREVARAAASRREVDVVQATDTAQQMAAAMNSRLAGTAPPTEKDYASYSESESESRDGEGTKRGWEEASDANAKGRKRSRKDRKREKKEKKQGKRDRKRRRKRGGGGQAE